MHRVPLVATAHAAVTLALALLIALTSRRSLDVAYICAYVAGAEVLWRMSRAAIFYEGAKYVIAACFLIALGRMVRKQIPIGVLFYFLALLPSAYILYDYYGFRSATRQALAFHLAGPFLMMAAACFFVNVAMTREQFWKLLLLFVTPIVGIASITVVSTHTLPEEITFREQSNKLASGGFGPNQVSAVLGLGLLILLLYLIQERFTLRQRTLVIGALVIFAMQSALTFSRGGLYAAFGAFLPAAFILAKHRRFRSRLVFAAAGLGLFAILVVIPYLINFTGGSIAKRFGSTKMTGREEILLADLELWKRNPVFGVGVGLSGYGHRGYAASHNEFTRLLAEHGIMGIFGCICLLSLAVHRFFRARGIRERAIVAAMCTWSFLFLGANGFRIAAPAFAFGLGCLDLRARSWNITPLRHRPRPPLPALAERYSA